MSNLSHLTEEEQAWYSALVDAEHRPTIGCLRGVIISQIGSLGVKALLTKLNDARAEVETLKEAGRKAEAAFTRYRQGLDDIGDWDALEEAMIAWKVALRGEQPDERQRPGVPDGTPLCHGGKP